MASNPTTSTSTTTSNAPPPSNNPNGGGGGGGGGAQVKALGMVGKYRLEKTLGQGSFASVLQAVHVDTGVRYALKKIVRERLDARLEAALKREIELMKEMEPHPNIVRLYEDMKSATYQYIVVELCPGGDLAKFIKSRKRLSEDLSRKFMYQIMCGMKYLFSKNIIHRDLKPANILLTEDSENATLKIADFGFATVLNEAKLAQTPCGSPLYMAPEILDYQSYDSKVDVWSLGCIYFEMLVGKPPFSGRDQRDLLNNIKTTRLAMPTSLNISKDSVSILESTLRIEREKRIPVTVLFSASSLLAGMREKGDSNGNSNILNSTTLEEKRAAVDATPSASSGVMRFPSPDPPSTSNNINNPNGNIATTHNNINGANNNNNNNNNNNSNNNNNNINNMNNNNNNSSNGNNYQYMSNLQKSRNDSPGQLGVGGEVVGIASNFNGSTTRVDNSGYNNNAKTTLNQVHNQGGQNQSRTLHTPTPLSAVYKTVVSPPINSFLPDNSSNTNNNIFTSSSNTNSTTNRAPGVPPLYTPPKQESYGTSKPIAFEDDVVFVETPYSNSNSRDNSSRDSVSASQLSQMSSTEENVIKFWTNKFKLLMSAVHAMTSSADSIIEEDLKEAASRDKRESKPRRRLSSVDSNDDSAVSDLLGGAKNQSNEQRRRKSYSFGNDDMISDKQPQKVDENSPQLGWRSACDSLVLYLHTLRFLKHFHDEFAKNCLALNVSQNSVSQLKANWLSVYDQLLIRCDQSILQLQKIDTSLRINPNPFDFDYISQSQMMNNPEFLLYNTAIKSAKQATVEELLGNFKKANTLYTSAKTLLQTMEWTVSDKNDKVAIRNITENITAQIDKCSLMANALFS